LVAGFGAVGVADAMDPAVGAREIRVVMEHTGKKGEPAF